MRNAFATGFWRWVLIILMSILIVSFAIWGIGDIFRGFGRERLVTVGNTEITAERFRNEFDRERQNLSRRTGQPINNDQARALGLHEQILQRLIAEAALDERARQLVLGISDAELARQIVEDPNFTGGGPGFNRAFFQQLLQANNLSEASYVAQRRALTIRQQIAQALTGGLAAPTVYDEVLHRFQSERRAVSYIVLPAERFADVAPPTDTVLESYYSLVSAAFRSPEMRTADILFLVPQAMAGSIQVSDEDARVIYDNNRARWGTPERRRVDQLTFETAAAAAEAVARLASGTSFDELVTAAGRSASDVDLGLMSREQFIDPAIRDAVFALAQGAVSGVIQGRFATAIVRVSDIQPGAVRAFDQVKDQIKGELALERARRQVFDVHDRVEEDRLGGMRLADVAQKHSLTLISVVNVDRNGRTPEGQEAPGLVGGRTTLDALFSAQPGQESDSIQLRDVGGYVWIDLKEVTPERDRPLAEVREQVTARWLDEQRRAVLGTKATELVERLRSGTTLEAIAAEIDVEFQQSVAFTRRDSIAGFSRAAIDEVFRVAEGRPGSATAENNVDRIVFVVTATETPRFDPETDQSVGEELSPAIQNDVLAQYIRRLERDLGATVNRAVLTRIINPTTGN
jgi:peptidyl-prolyl cis-trans isomerase D